MRRQREDSEGLPAPARQGWFWPVLCGLLLGLVIGFFSGFIGALAVLRDTTARSQSKSLTVSQLRETVVGKTPDEVIAAIGRPGSTSEETERAGQQWNYYHRFIDPVSQKPTAWTTLKFTRGADPVVEKVE